MKLADLIAPFAPAEGAPPRDLGAFMVWGLQGSWPVLWAATALSAAAGVTEVVSALILGR